MSYAVSMSSHLTDCQHQQGSNKDGASIPLAASAVASDTHPVVKEIQAMIEFALTSCKPPNDVARNRHTYTSGSSLGASFTKGRSGAFLLHELGCAVRSGKLVPSIHGWLEEHFEREFAETYVGKLNNL